MSAGSLRIRVDEHALRELRDFLREHGCIAEQARRAELEVYLPSAEDRRGELRRLLATWRSRRPEVLAELVS